MKTSRRRLSVVLHWLSVMLVLIMIKGGVSSPWALWAFVAVTVLWSGMTLWNGLLGRPGPKLSPPMRRAYPWMHRLLHILLALTALAILARLMGRPLPWLDAWTLLLVTLCAGTFHGLFHFWRHNVLFDGALKLITPRVMPRWL